MDVKLCKDCSWSNTIMVTGGGWELRCLNPHVIARDAYALSHTKMIGTACLSERQPRWFAPCGQQGKLFKLRAAQ